ncbi:acyl carrier protein [Cellvibrio sp. KY-GH-1]|uniref:acyl carrier protein n=1 Tax=Cellvibrio sp. KY-GH-1 TaxID=2303332 RepID=UPI001247B286|nr:acyl carrier protein [Cellvibrio sp. KY-GH-1]QEY17418.1 acyl carrier protein [Cellvibrio sp. KY-GH-1]
MADKNAIFEHVVTTLADLFDLDPKEIHLESHLGDDLDIDSIDAIDLVVELKKFVGKKISPEDFKAVRTVEDIVNAVSELMDKAE